MPDLFSPYTLKGVTLRNRIGMSPMTMYQSVDGYVDDFHTMYLGARAAGGFGLVFPEQIAISPEGRTSVHCAGIWDDAQIEGLAKVCSIIKRMGGVPAIQLGHTGRKGSALTPWEGGAQIPPEAPTGWQVTGPSAIPYGGTHDLPVHALTVEEIAQIYRQYADAARRAADAGFEWLEMHYAHGYLGASFLSPLANQRTDAYGGSLANRMRFHLEALDAVRAVWPERLPLTCRLGGDDKHPDGTQPDDAIVTLSALQEHGLDLADVSLGFNTDDLADPSFFGEVGFMNGLAARVKREVGLPVATSWNLGLPQNADRAVRDGVLDVVLLGCPALSNPHWPVWAARELGHEDPFSLVPNDWGHWLNNFRGHAPSIGLPQPATDELSESGLQRAS